MLIKMHSLNSGVDKDVFNISQLVIFHTKYN